MRSVAVALDELVRRALDGRHAELRALVRREVDQRLAALVDELVIEELASRNGHVWIRANNPSSRHRDRRKQGRGAGSV
jgi:hypothetical protein